MAWNEFKANHLNKILREDLDREFEVDLKSHSDIYQPRKKWTIKAQVSQAHRIRLSKCANVVTLSRTQRKLYSTAVRFGRYSFTLALRSVSLHFSVQLLVMFRPSRHLLCTVCDDFASGWLERGSLDCAWAEGFLRSLIHGSNVAAVSRCLDALT